MNPQDFIFYRQNISSAGLKDPMPWKIQYVQFREMLAATVRMGGLERAMARIFRGETIKTRYGTYWAQKK